MLGRESVVQTERRQVFKGLGTGIEAKTLGVQAIAKEGVIGERHGGNDRAANERIQCNPTAGDNRVGDQEPVIKTLSRVGVREPAAIQQVNAPDQAGIGGDVCSRRRYPLQEAEYPLARLCCPHRAVYGNAFGEPRLLVAKIEEGLVFNNRPADAAPELVPNQFGDFRAGEVIEEIVGAELVVAVEFEKRAVPLIRARAGHGADLDATPAVLGRGVAGGHLEFLHVLGRQSDQGLVDHDGGGAVEVVLGIEAVEGDVDGAVALAVDKELHALAGGCLLVVHARLKKREFNGVAAVERQLQHAPFVNHGA